MDIEMLGQVNFTWDFLVGIASIVLIDVILSGDNAVVIAMAVRSLPEKERARGIALGAVGAVLLRVILTFFAAKLMAVDFLKIIGGSLILWIAVKLLKEEVEEEGGRHEAESIWHALWIILVADATMSLDNVLAVAGASNGNLFLLIFGLGLSIPFLVVSAGFLSKLMAKFPGIIYFGSAILGKVAGEMLLTDPVTVRTFHPGAALTYGLEAFLAVGVIIAARLLVRPAPEPEEG